MPRAARPRKLAVATSFGRLCTFNLFSPVGEVAAGSQGARALTAQHPLDDGQQRDVLVAGPGRIPRIPSPPGKFIAGPQGVGVLGAQHPFADGQQRSELVPGTGRIPRPPGVVGEVAAVGQGIARLIGSAV